MPMDKKPIMIAGIAAVFALGVVAASGMFSEAAGENPQKPSAPRYADTCAHGHNGFSCEQPRYKTDIDDLQKSTTDLENRVSQLEMR